MHPALAAEEMTQAQEPRRAPIPVAPGDDPAWDATVRATPCQYGARDGAGEALFFPLTSRALVTTRRGVRWLNASSIDDALDSAHLPS